MAALARIISSAAVSLGVCSQNAQIRASTCFALVSSGAAFSAPKRKSSPRVRSAPTFGSLLGGSGRSLFCLGGGGGPGGHFLSLGRGGRSLWPRGPRRQQRKHRRQNKRGGPSGCARESET